MYLASATTHDSPDSAFSVSAHSMHSSDSLSNSMYPEDPSYSDSHLCRVVRGIAQGGCSIKPPEEDPRPGFMYARVKLNFTGELIDSICNGPWSHGEIVDGRRIVRVERIQQNEVINVDFSIVGCADEFPNPAPAKPNVDFIEISCLSVYGPEMGNGFYITSVEVVAIVETLIGTRKMKDSSLRRRERGRIRSNLMSFWAKSSYHSKANEESRSDFAKRIMAYDIRKPRGFDKGFRILSWDRLIPALQRALQCYYAEVRKDEFELGSSPTPSARSVPIKNEDLDGLHRYEALRQF